MNDGAWDLDTVDRLLTTTRSVRLGLDLAAPVTRDLVLDCLRIALQAPNGGNQQTWRWIVVTDPGQRKRIGDIYRDANPEYEALLHAQAQSGDAEAARAYRSSSILWRHLGEVPALLFACFEKPAWHDQSTYAQASVYGSVFPAVWNFQLAARSRGLGTCLITSHLKREAEIREALDLPDNIVQAAMLAVGHLKRETSTAAPRHPVESVTYFDRWPAKA